MEYSEDTTVTDLASPSKKIKKAIQKPPRSPSERSQEGSPTLPKSRQRRSRAQSSELLDKKKRNQKGQQGVTDAPSPYKKSGFSKLIPLQIRRRLGNANLTPEEIEAEVAKLAVHAQKKPFDTELQRIKELNALQENSIKDVLSNLGISKPNFMSYLDIYTGLTSNRDWIPQPNTTNMATAPVPVTSGNPAPAKPPAGFSTNSLLVPPSHFLKAQPYAGFSPNLFRNPPPAPPANTPVPGVHNRLSHQLTVQTQHHAMPYHHAPVQAPAIQLQHIPPHPPFQMDDGMSLTHQLEGMTLEQNSPYPPLNPEVITFDDQYIEQSSPYSPKSDSMFYAKRKIASRRIEDLSDLFFNEAGEARGDIAHGDTEEPNDSGNKIHSRPLFNLAPVEMDHHHILHKPPSMVDELFDDDFKNFQL